MEKRPFFIIDAGTVQELCAGKKNFDLYFVSYVRINLKWVIDMKVKQKIIIRLGSRRQFLLSW